MLRIPKPLPEFYVIDWQIEVHVECQSRLRSWGATLVTRPSGECGVALPSARTSSGEPDKLLAAVRDSVEHRADRVRLYSVFPIAWSAFRMGYGYDRNSVVGEVVDNLVRESTKQHAPSAGLRIERANVRLSFNARRCFCHAVEEVSAQTRALLLVPAYGGSKLFASSGKGPNTSAHRPRRSRSIRRLATSQASSLAEPDSRAATRRLISAVQAEAASGSAGPSRLARSSEASSARPFKSRRSASARTVSVVFVMVPYISA